MLSLDLSVQGALLLEELINEMNDSTSACSSNTGDLSGRDQPESMRSPLERFISAGTQSSRSYASGERGDPHAASSPLAAASSRLAAASSRLAANTSISSSVIKVPSAFELAPEALERWLHTGVYDDPGEVGSGRPQASRAARQMNDGSKHR
ncbi:hypothetical protein DFH06DRAFT_1181232 [Mycena polygramma]|nr:hypothetical protein DFH06DRAFT_1181232 [Mycena polygramma]